MHNHREFTCKRDVTLVNRNTKSLVVSRTNAFHQNKKLPFFYILHKLHFHANNVTIHSFLKIHVYLHLLILLWKTPYGLVFSAGSS